MNVADAKDLAFACQPGCGFCCSASPLVHAREAPALGALVVNGRIPVRGQACSALGSDRACTVYEARPAACRLYPFMVHAGRRVQVTVALACPGVTEGAGAEPQAEGAAQLALARPGAAEMAARAKETFAEYDRRMKEWGVATSGDKLRSAFLPHLEMLSRPSALPSFFAGLASGDLTLDARGTVAEVFEAEAQLELVDLFEEAAQEAFDGTVLWVDPSPPFAWRAPTAADARAETLVADWSDEATSVLATYLRRLMSRDHTEGASAWLVDQSGYQATPAAAFARVLGEASLHVALRAGLLARDAKLDEVDSATAWRAVRAYETSYHALPTLGSIL